ncbi:hypothetical protein BGZ58_002554 [Dissophora ornata]|nr:hypothetical protein BGZ58_002554 [Dissophora ornata]
MAASFLKMISFDIDPTLRRQARRLLQLRATVHRWKPHRFLHLSGRRPPKMTTELADTVFLAFKKKLFALFSSEEMAQQSGSPSPSIGVWLGPLM